MTTKTIKDKPECICRYFTDNLGVEQRITKPACPKHGKASICSKCGKSYLRKRAYDRTHEVLYIHTEELRKGPIPHMAILEYCLVKEDER